MQTSYDVLSSGAHYGGLSIQQSWLCRCLQRHGSDESCSLTQPHAITTSNLRTHNLTTVAKLTSLTAEHQEINCGGENCLT